jgi:NAD(P)H-dependent flavin oxidoreductase YrpB (nitropropane dioxygenase family)
VRFPETAFTKLVGCRIPIQQAGMGGVSTPELAAAVAGEGGLGMLGAAGLTAEQVADQIRTALGAAGEGGYVGVNFLVPFLDRAAFDAAAALAPVVECFYGAPEEELVDRGRAGGALVAWQVGSLDEARAAVDAGCDFLVVQGHEAGGHVRGTTPLLELLPAVRATTELPLVAAGGIGSGAQAAAALAVGADAVRIGTLLLPTPEADVHPDYARALVEATAEDTVVTETFSLAWPHAPHRVLRRCIDASDDDPATRSPLPPTRDVTGSVDAAALYAGTSVAGVRRVEPAAQVVQDLLEDITRILDRRR